MSAAWIFGPAPTTYRARGPLGGERVLHAAGDAVGRRGELLRDRDHAPEALGVAGVHRLVLGGELAVVLIERGGGVVPDVGGGLRGLDEAHLHAPRLELQAQRIADALQCELRAVVGTAHRRGDPAADRRDEHDPALGGAQPRQHGLGDGDLPEDVDLELATQLVERQPLDRSADEYARVVDDGVERRRERGVECRHLLGIGDVERDRRDAAGALGCQRDAVGLAAHAAEDVPAGIGEAQGDGATDAARGTGDQNSRHGRRPWGEARSRTILRPPGRR